LVKQYSFNSGELLRIHFINLFFQTKKVSQVPQWKQGFITEAGIITTEVL